MLVAFGLTAITWVMLLAGFISSADSVARTLRPLLDPLVFIMLLTLALLGIVGGLLLPLTLVRSDLQDRPPT